MLNHQEKGCGPRWRASWGRCRVSEGGRVRGSPCGRGRHALFEESIVNAAGQKVEDAGKMRRREAIKAMKTSEELIVREERGVACRWGRDHPLGCGFHWAKYEGRSAQMDNVVVTIVVCLTKLFFFFSVEELKSKCVKRVLGQKSSENVNVV